MGLIFPLGTFCPWDVLSLGTFCPWDVLSWDVLSWNILYVHPSTVGSEGDEGESTIPMAAFVRLPARGASSGILNLAGHNSCMLERSTPTLKLDRKSAPMMGKATSACKNLQMKCRPPEDIYTWWRPQAFMEAPEAAVRAGLVGWAVLCWRRAGWSKQTQCPLGSSPR